MAGGIRDFRVADRQKNPSEELIISWIVDASIDISDAMIESSFFLSVSKSCFFFYASLA